MEKINWRGIPGYEDYYEVSDTGLVRALPRIIFAREPRGLMGLRQYEERLLTQTLQKNGYYSVKLCVRGKPKTHHVHDLVAMTFLGLRPPSLERIEICHGDGVRGNNTLGNLRYDTCKANARDRVRHERERRASK